MMHRLFLLALSSLFVGAAIVSAAIPEPVKIDAGMITGTSGAAGDDVRVFKGILYAAPQVGGSACLPAESFGFGNRLTLA